MDPISFNQMAEEDPRKKSDGLRSEVSFPINIRDSINLRSSPKKTLVLFGNPRGGTTMIANVVRSMGVYLGDNLPINLEDSKFNWNAIGKDKSLNREKKIALLKKNIIKRNSEQEVWGWKYPRVDKYFDDIFPDLVNPMLVCVYRDPIASSWRGVVRKQRSAAKAIQTTLELHLNNLQMIKNSGAPALLISYEKAIANPPELVKILNQFMVLDLGDEEIMECAKRVNPELGYRASNL